MSEPVTVKGNGNILQFWFDESLPYAELKEALIKRLDVNASFYIGSRRPVVFYGKQFTDIQKRELKNLMLSQYCFDDVCFADDTASEVPQKRVPKAATQPRPVVSEHSCPVPQPKARPVSVPQTQDRQNSESIYPEHLFISHTVRSGQRIQASGDITIIGDVNSGAEVIAGGSVAVFGRLSGMVHAGAFGNPDVTIAANRLMASQIRLCGKIAVLPGDHIPEKPEIVKYIDGKLIISSIN